MGQYQAEAAKSRKRRPFGRLALMSLDWPEPLGARRPVCMVGWEPIERIVSG
jgi:hypothetical protein